MKNKIITQKELKRLLYYDPKTGIFRWLVARKSVKMGDVAGSIDNRYGYNLIRINGKLYKASRLAFLYMEGYFPEHEIDHIDRNQSNDTWKNLRHVSHLCNMRNRKISCKNKSGVSGVSWSKRDNKWRARIEVHGKRKHLGSYNNLIDAAKARWLAEKEYGWPDCNTSSSAFNFLQAASNLKENQ